MARVKSIFVCNACGTSLAKWQGQCPDCQAWNSIVETAAPVASSQHPRHQGYAGASLGQVQKLTDVAVVEQDRICTGFTEMDRVLGGGLVPGSVVLIGGNPGAGKSTLLLQVLTGLSGAHPCLYVTGEESLQQVSLRARRLGLSAPALSLLAQTHIEVILKTAEQTQPKVLVIDSIQVMHCEAVQSAPGSVSQVRESAAMVTRFAKQTNTIVILVGHMTKDGALAGPKVLEHMIDCSLVLESTDNQRFRILRSHKNRFGAIHEMGVFAMLEQGMKEVTNPSALFLSKQSEPAPGSVVTVLWEGTRPLLVEVQALVDDKQGGYPSRITVGTDTTRLMMLLAILHKQSGIGFSDQDVFINLVGGVRSAETSVDLAVVFSLVSSFRNHIIPPEWVVMGEVGLSGEIRPMPYGQERIIEAAKHGFKVMVVPKRNLAGFKAPSEIEVIGVSRIKDALQCLG